MNQIANTIDVDAFDDSEARALERRIFRVMVVAVALAVVVSAVLAPWRVTTGLFLGGVLSLLNYHWLETSIAAAFQIEGAGKRPHLKASRFIVRYLFIGAVVFVAYKLKAVSLPAAILGLTSFVVALFAEAFREFYFAIIHREETD
jgi:ATP synthase I subunit